VAGFRFAAFRAMLRHLEEMVAATRTKRKTPQYLQRLVFKVVLNAIVHSGNYPVVNSAELPDQVP
jgi:hypothetical protein